MLGSGPPLVLLHGTGGHAENFSRNLNAYAKNYRVIAIDLLWHGYSDLDGFNPEVIPPLVDHVLDVLDTLNIERSSIEGQSLGGWVAASLAANHPDRVDALILTTPMGIRVDDPEAESAVDWGALRDNNIATLRAPTLENVRRRLERIVYDSSIVTDEAVQTRHKIYNREGLADIQVQLMQAYLGGEAVKPHEITRDVARAITAPTLIYWGANNIVGEATGKWLAAAMERAEFYSAARTGHWAQYENADEHNRVVLDFLSRHSANTAAENA